MAGFVTIPLQWSVVHQPAATVQATATRSAPAAGYVHHCTGIVASIAGDIAASAIVAVNLRDSTTGAGNVILAAALRGTITAGNQIVITGIDIPGVAAAAMTLEFAAGGGTGSVESVTLLGYTAAA